MATLTEGATEAERHVAEKVAELIGRTLAWMLPEDRQEWATKLAEAPAIYSAGPRVTIAAGGEVFLRVAIWQLVPGGEDVHLG
jgi:hypothetical protein